MKSTLPLLASAVLMLAFSQDRTASSESDWPLGGLKLLPGYTYTPLQTAGCPYGTIVKRDGLSIRFDGGQCANFAEDLKAKEKAIWSSEQKICGQKATVVITNENEIVASFGPSGLSANFACRVKSAKEATEFLLMALTYPDKVETQK